MPSDGLWSENPQVDRKLNYKYYRGMGNEYVCILTGNRNNFLQSFRQLLDEEIIDSRVIILWEDPTLDGVAAELKQGVEKLPVSEVVTKQTDNPYETMKKLISRKRSVFWKEDVVLAPGNIVILNRTLLAPNAGIVSATGRELNLLVDNIYEPTTRLMPKEIGMITPVDLATLDLCVIKSSVIQEMGFNTEWFGLDLRRLGYQNYLDTTINIDYVNEENKNAQNYNAQGLAS